MSNLFSFATPTPAGRARRWLSGALGLLLPALGAQAQQLAPPSFFTTDASARQAAAASPVAARLQAARPLTLNAAGMRAALATAPLEGRAAAAPLLLALPLPDGTTATFRVLEAPVMAPALAAQFPAIKTYVGVGVDDPTASLRLDFTPLGFHAQVLSPATGAFYIDPASRATTTQYLSFWKRDMPGNSFTCEVKNSLAARKAGGASQRITSRTLRTYRLALAATGEYTAYYGGTVAAAQAAIVTSVNRVVGVYEKELDVRMVLVATNSQLIYTDATTDPYTNNDGSAMLDENQTNVDALIGSANYDIGHVFSTGGGGIAGLGVVCQAGLKAQGVTGSPAPVGDAFDIDYVAHEMGHQFGGNHTFNSTAGSCNGNRNPSTAYEPGSGSTIMAYAGICGTASNLQPNSDPYFHVISFEEMQAYIGTTTCAVTSSTGNSAPVVTLPAGGKVLPISTPFRLTGNAYDQDGDALSYCWEEFDLGTSGSPTATQTANNNVPLFRSFNPTTSPTRYFPRLSSLVANTVVIGERLPTVSRSLKFRLTVRDQHNGTQGIVGGINSGFSTLDLTTTNAAGPFLVTVPNTAVTWAGRSSEVVTWNVAGTTANGVNCATVNIRLSTDGGLTYPTVLLANTPNDGTEPVTVPTVSTTAARIMVEAADNYFFDISNANFTIISPATPCDAATNLAVGSITRTSASLSFTGSAAASYTVTTSPATATYTAATSPVSLTGLAAGTTYTVSITGNCGTVGNSATATTTFATPAPPTCNEATNLAVRNITSTGATFSFTPNATAGTYTITTVPATTTQTVATGPVSFTGLTPGTNYTISIASNCAGSTITDVLAFGTRPLNDECSAAVGLTSGTSCVTTAGTLTGATESRPASSCSGFVSPSANDVWYTFVATGNTHTIRVAGTPDGVLEVLTGTCGSFSSVGCVDAAGSGGETYTSAGFVNGTRYYVRYYAYGTTPPDGTFTICVTNPVCNPPTALALTSSTATSLTVSFTAASGTNAAGYVATATPSAGGPAQTVTATASPVTFNNLTPGISYVVSVATNCTNSGPSAAATATYSTAALTDLTVSTAQAVGGAYNNVTITSGGVATLAANLTVYGVLTVQSGGSLQTDATFDVQGPGSLVLAAGATLIEVNAAGLANTAGGFALTGAAGLSLSPDANYVFAGTAAQQTGPLQPNGARNLTVNNAAGVTLTNNLAVRQVVRLQSGNLALGGRVLRLLSSAAGTALVDNTGGAVLGSTASMQRALTGGVMTGPAYRHFSSPVQVVAVDSLGTGGVAPVFNPAYNTSATPYAVVPFPTVFGYNQNRIATTTSNASDFDKGYFSPASGDMMQPTRGYTVNTPATTPPVRFTGTFNNGPQNSGTLARLNATTATGWQLLGNPYPAPLDWSTVTGAQRPGMSAAMYVYQSTSQYNGVYRTYINGIGSASPLIEAGSGYFVQVAAAGTPGAVNLTNANRVTTFGTQNAFGRPTADLRPQLRLRVAGTGLTDDAFLYFEAGATTGIDLDYDAAKLPNSTGLNLAALAGSAPLAVQGLAPLTGTAEVVVPLALATPAPGSFAFEVADLANFTGLAVYLRDTQAGTQQPLLAGTRYAFAQAAGAATTGRFALVFRPAGVLATQSALSAAQVSVFPNPAHGSFSLLLPPVAGQRAVQATLLSVLGQPVASRSIGLSAAGATAEFDTRGLAAGVYVLRLVAGDQALTLRVTLE